MVKPGEDRSLSIDNGAPRDQGGEPDESDSSKEDELILVGRDGRGLLRRWFTIGSRGGGGGIGKGGDWV